MQSIPGYYPQGFPPTSPYPTSSSANTSTIMTSSPTPIMATNLPPLQAQAHSMSTTPVTDGSKRKQVKNACTNCQKACKKCDDSRPCPRCVKYGVTDSCINSVRKERKKGIKRGPYKRRQKTDEEAGNIKVDHISINNGNHPHNSNGNTTNDHNNGSNNNSGNNNNASNDVSSSNFYNTFCATPLIGMPFGYPSQLNQYGQPYDPYATYATYGKDQILPQSYVISSVYPQVGYPVLVPTTTSEDTNSPQQQAAAAAYAQLSQQHFTGILTQRSDSQQHQQFSDQTTAYYQKTENSSSSPPTASSSSELQSAVANTNPVTENVASTATPEEQVITAVAAAIKETSMAIAAKNAALENNIRSEEEKKEDGRDGEVNTTTVLVKGVQEKPQPMTPVPSTSSGASSPPSDTQETEDHHQPVKLSGLSQLCSAALDQNRETESKENETDI